MELQVADQSERLAESPGLVMSCDEVIGKLHALKRSMSSKISRSGFSSSSAFQGSGTSSCMGTGNNASATGTTEGVENALTSTADSMNVQNNSSDNGRSAINNSCKNNGSPLKSEMADTKAFYNEMIIDQDQNRSQQRYGHIQMYTFSNPYKFN